MIEPQRPEQRPPFEPQQPAQPTPETFGDVAPSSYESPPSYQRPPGKPHAGANWLLWIAALTGVNVVLAVSESDVSFAVGIVTSQLIALVGVSVGREAGLPLIGYVAAVVALLPALGALAAWFPARHGNRWALGISLVLYGIDTAIHIGLMLMVGEADVLGFVIHAWAMFALFSAWTAAASHQA